MGKVLLFGGLTSFGQPIINQLLIDGHEIIAVRAFSSEETSKEEYFEMLVGRNALFQSIHGEWKPYARQADTVIFLDTTSFISETDYFVTPDAIRNRLLFILEECSELKKLIIASHIDIYGSPIGKIDEQTQVAPRTNKGHQVDEVERGVIESLLLNKNKARTVCAFLLRLPNIYTQYSSDYAESLHIDDVATGISALLHLENGPGIIVLQLTSGRNFGLAQYPYEKAKQLINFVPNKTLETTYLK